MIKKLKAYDEYPTAPLATVLDSEWDVLSALHRALKRFQTYPKIKWVQSHQDDKVHDAKEMPIDAYLNSEADELATIGLKRLQEKPQVPMDPNTNIQLHIGGRTITRDLTGFLLLPQYWGRILGSFFYGGLSSSKTDLLPPLERERNSVQKHVSSY
jgi:hypothetical protein